MNQSALLEGLEAIKAPSMDERMRSKRSVILLTTTKTQPDGQVTMQKLTSANSKHQLEREERKANVHG